LITAPPPSAQVEPFTWDLATTRLTPSEPADEVPRGQSVSLGIGWKLQNALSRVIFLRKPSTEHRLEREAAPCTDRLSQVVVGMKQAERAVAWRRHFVHSHHRAV